MSQALEALRRQEIEAAEAGDVEALLRLRTDDFVALPPGQPPVRGIGEVRSYLEAMFAGVSIQETVTSERVEVAGELAYDRGVYTGTATVEDSGDTMALDGKYLWVARRSADGSWRYCAQMWSDNRS